MGSSIDVSSTGQLVNRLMNPPDMGAQFAKGLDTLNAWKNFQAQQASADAYKQSVDPVTGEVDLGKYKSLLSQGPGAWAFGPLVTSGGQAVGAVGQGTTADVNAKMRQIDATGQMMFPLLRDGAATQSIDPARVQAQLDQAHVARLITDQQYNVWSSQLKGMTPQQAYGFVLGANEGNEGARYFLAPQMYNYGGGGVNIQPSSPGGVTAGTVIPHTLSPSEASTIVPVQIGNGQVLQVPLAQAWPLLQNNPALQKLNPNITAPAATPAPASGGGAGAEPGRYPRPAAPAATPTPEPAVTGPAYRQAPGPSPSEAGGVGTTQVPGYTETVQQPSMKAATALVTAANDTPNVSALIDDMRSQVNQPGWNPGLGAQAGSTWRQVLDKVGINATGSAPTAIKDAQAAYDEFAKDANLIASRQLATIGNPSDARQGLAEAITPGMAQSKEGVLGISATLKGNQDAINRTSAAWNEAKANGWTDSRHLEWLNKNWNATDKATGGKFDPRVFWLADTAGNADDQWRRMASKIPKEQQTQFLKNVQYAKGQGWISQDGQGGAFSVVNP